MDIDILSVQINISECCKRSRVISTRPAKKSTNESLLGLDIYDLTFVITEKIHLG